MLYEKILNRKLACVIVVTMNPRVLAENLVVVFGLFGFGIILSLLIQLFIGPSFPISEESPDPFADATWKGIIFGCIGGYVMGVIAGIAIKEEE